WSCEKRQCAVVSKPKLKYGPTRGTKNTQQPSAISRTAGTITAAVQPPASAVGGEVRVRLNMVNLLADHGPIPRERRRITGAAAQQAQSASPAAGATSGSSRGTKELPQPQEAAMFGLVTWNPAPVSPST